MGTVVELGVANMVAQNPKAVRTGFQLLKLFLSGSPARKARKPQGRDMGGI
jgi:hypothetical protein